jgi:hypothetical protein
MRRARVIAVVGGLLVGVALAEAGARLLSPNPGEELLFNAPDAAPTGLYRYSPTVLLEPTPGFAGTIRSLGYSVPLRIDSFGLRGAEPGTGPKWLAVGDSFTMAVQVAEADTFEDRLGAALGVEVLNAGVDGYSTWQATLRYRSLDASPGVDAVLLTFFLGNDLADNDRAPVMLQHPQPPGVGGHPLPVLSTDPVTRFLFAHSVLFAYGRVAWKRHLVERGDDFDGKRFKDELAIFSKPGRAQLDHLLPASAAALRELRDETARRGDRLLVAVAPPSFAVDPAMGRRLLDLFRVTDPDLDAPRAAVVATLGQLGIPTCDLGPPLAAAIARGEHPYFRFDGHWTSVGHAIVADTLAGCAKRAAAAP